MRYIQFLLFLVLLSSCDDGDYETPSFEFKTDVYKCGEHVLYRVNSSKTEALIIKLTKKQFPNTILKKPKEISITGDNLEYRMFSAAIGSDYFCQDVPPIAPNVVKCWLGVKGANNKIVVSTDTIFSEDLKDTTYYQKIELQNMILKHDDEVMTFDNYYFGRRSFKP